MQFGSSLPALLFLYEAFPLTGRVNRIYDAIRVAGQPASKFKRTGQLFEDERLRGYTLLRLTPKLSVVEIGIAYTFDWYKYEEDLRRHGVH